MPRKNAKSGAASASRGRKPDWVDPDDAPEITDETLDRATVVKGGVVVQRGRAPLGAHTKRDR